MSCHIHGMACSVASPLFASPCARAGAVPRLRSRIRGCREEGPGRARCAAEGRHGRRDRLVGRRPGRHRLGGGNRETRARHRRVSERCRSGPRRKVRVPQRTESPAGLELVPQQPGRIQRRAVRAAQDDSRSRSESIAIRRCAPSLASGSARRVMPAGSGSVRHAPGRSITSASDPTRPTTPMASRARRASASRRCRSDLRSRIRARSNRCRPPRTALDDARLLAKRVFQNTSLLIAKVRTVDKEENWEQRPRGLWQPRHAGSGVLFVRGLSRRPRDGVREDEIPPRHAQYGD